MQRVKGVLVLTSKRDIHIVGSNGFIGNAIKRMNKDLHIVQWSHSPLHHENYFDLYDQTSWENLLTSNISNIVILSWPGLPNYNSNIHITKNLHSYTFLIDKLLEKNIKKITIAGTCYEYGIKEGEIDEETRTDPINSYGIAKDALRKYLAYRCINSDINWCWLRIFYPYGEGQKESSLIPQIDKAIDNKEKTFRMSSGKQIRDYINVNDLAEQILAVVSSQESKGVYNCGSGNPVSLYNIVKDRIQLKHSNLMIETSYYQDRKDEPNAFWAKTDRIKALMNG